MLFTPPIDIIEIKKKKLYSYSKNRTTLNAKSDRIRKRIQNK